VESESCLKEEDDDELSFAEPPEEEFTKEDEEFDESEDSFEPELDREEREDSAEEESS
jgi:hypothetical protein